MNLVGNEFDKLNYMYYLIWSSGCWDPKVGKAYGRKNCKGPQDD